MWFKSLHRLEFYSVLQPDPFKLENRTCQLKPNDFKKRNSLNIHGSSPKCQRKINRVKRGGGEKVNQNSDLIHA